MAPDKCGKECEIHVLCNKPCILDIGHPRSCCWCGVETERSKEIREKNKTEGRE